MRYLRKNPTSFASIPRVHLHVIANPSFWNENSKSEQIKGHWFENSHLSKRHKVDLPLFHLFLDTDKFQVHVAVKTTVSLSVDRKMMLRNEIRAATWVQIWPTNQKGDRFSQFGTFYRVSVDCSSIKRVRSNGSSFIFLATCVWLSWPRRSCKCGFGLPNLVEICFSRTKSGCTKIPRVSRSHLGGHRKALPESAAEVILEVIQNPLNWDMHLFWEFFTTGFNCHTTPRIEHTSLCGNYPWSAVQS